MPDQNMDPPEERFEDLLRESAAAASQDLRIGDRIETAVIAVGRDAVFVDTGMKIDGAVERSELTDADGNLTVQVGDTVTLYVVALSEDEIRLSKAVSGAGGAELLREAYDARLPVEGKVKAQIKGGFQVDVMGKRAFCPISQMDLRYVENPEPYIGETFNFQITRFEGGGKNIVLSRRQLLEAEQARARGEFLKDLAVGAVLEGKVASVMPYGAFVELFAGLEGMVHISEMSWSRLETPEEKVRSGDAVTVKVIGIDTSQDPNKPRIALSMKQVDGDPWETCTDRFAAGEKVTGKVTRLADFGAFVELAEGIEGLVHLSEMSFTRRVIKADEVVAVGETVSVLIKDIDPKKRRISLSIKEAEGDPWADITDKFTAGQQVRGTLEKKERFGHFIRLAPGITGLLPKSKISASPNASALDAARPGDSVEVVIESIQADARKISLNPTGTAEGGEEWRQYTDQKPAQTDISGGGLGSLGDILKEAMRKKGQ